MSAVSQRGGNRAETGIQESSLASCLSGKVIILSEPTAVAVHWPDKIKQSGFAVFTHIIVLTYIRSNCVCMS